VRSTHTRAVLGAIAAHPVRAGGLAQRASQLMCYAGDDTQSAVLATRSVASGV
jgi:hypothetical protein